MAYCRRSIRHNKKRWNSYICMCNIFMYWQYILRPKLKWRWEERSATFYNYITHIQIVGVCINFKEFSRDGVTSTIASGHIIATFMSKYWCHHHVALVQYMSFCRSVNNIVFLGIEYIEFCVNKMQFAGSFAFLLPFEEKWCWKSINAFGSLRWLYSIDFMNTGFDAIKKVILTRKTRNVQDNRKNLNMRKWKLY